MKHLFRDYYSEDSSVDDDGVDRCDNCGKRVEEVEELKQCEECNNLLCEKCSGAWHEGFCHKCYKSISKSDPVTFPPILDYTVVAVPKEIRDRHNKNELIEIIIDYRVVKYNGKIWCTCSDPDSAMKVADLLNGLEI